MKENGKEIKATEHYENFQIEISPQQNGFTMRSRRREEIFPLPPRKMIINYFAFVLPHRMRLRNLLLNKQLNGAVIAMVYSCCSCVSDEDPEGVAPPLSARD